MIFRLSPKTSGGEANPERETIMPTGEYSWVVWIVGLVVFGAVFIVAILYGRGLKVRRNPKGGLEVKLDDSHPEKRPKVTVFAETTLNEANAEAVGVQDTTSQPNSNVDIEVGRKAVIKGGTIKAVGVQLGPRSSKDPQ
jgi:hypothetical protein